jgi:integrase
LTRQKWFEQKTGGSFHGFSHRDGKPIKDFRWVWASACKNAGVPGRIPHDFRITAVRNLERAGVPRSVAMAMVGHRTEAIYRRYAIADEAMLKEGAARLAALHAREATVENKVVAIKEGAE